MYVYSNMHDSVAQRTLVACNRTDEVAWCFQTRINFVRFVGYDPLFTDANVFDGAAFETLLREPEQLKKLKVFGTPGLESGARIPVSCREKTLIDSLVSAVRGSDDRMYGFAFSLIVDDHERAAFAKHCRSKGRDTVYDFPSLVKFVRQSAKDEIITSGTAERLVDHWQRCSETEAFQPIHRPSTKVSLRCSCSWGELPSKWESICGGHAFTEPATEYWIKVAENQFSRSAADGLYHEICGQLNDTDKALLTLHSFVFSRLYNREIAGRNEAAFDDYSSRATYPICAEERFYEALLEGTGTDGAKIPRIRYSAEVFDSLMNIDQARLNEILRQTHFDMWLHNRDVRALQGTLDELGSIQGYARPWRWLLKPACLCSDIVAGPATALGIALLNETQTSNILAPENLVAELGGLGVAWVGSSISRKGLALLFAIESLQREIISARDQMLIRPESSGVASVGRAHPN